VSRTLLVLALLAVATSARAKVARSSDALTVVTLNLWNDQGDWPKRLPVIVEGLRPLHPDVICLQEVLQHPSLPNQAQTLADSLGMAMQFASVDGPERPKRFGNAILTPHRVLRGDAVNLKPYDDYRAAAHVRFAWRGRTVDAYATHLHYTAAGGAIRARQVRDLLAFVDSTRAADGAVVIAGDLNCETGAPELDALWPDHVDAYRTLHPSAPRADAVTYNARFGEDPGAIDHVFARISGPRPLIPIECRVLFREPRADSVWVSDHFGLLARLAVAPAARGAARAAAPAALDTADVRRWSADLEFLAREAPRTHARLFHAMTREQFDSARVHMASWLPVMSRDEAIVSLMRLAALIGDGHTNVSPWRDTVIAFHTLPVALHRFADGWYVRAATRDRAGLLGARVTAIGGVPIDSAMARVAPLIGRDNAMAVRQYAPWLLVMPEVLHAVRLAPDARGAELTIEQGGRTRRVTLPAAARFPNLSGDNDRSWNARDGWIDARDRAPAPLWLSRNDTWWFTYVPDGRLLYCQLNEIQERDEPIEQFFSRALHAADSLGAEKFVLDLRRCGGGNGDYNRAIVRALVRSRFDARGRLYVVTGRRTFSAAQMLIDHLEAWSQPIFVGEPAASRGNVYGDSKKLVLPNSRVTFRVSTLYWQQWDPRDTRAWIAPELAAPLTFAAYRAGRDPALEAIARDVPHADLVDELRPLLAAGDRAAARHAIESFRNDSRHAWIDPAGALEALARESRWNKSEAPAALADELRAGLPRWRMPD